MYVSYRIHRRHFYHRQTIFPSGFSALLPIVHRYFEILLHLKIINFGYTKERTCTTIHINTGAAFSKHRWFTFINYSICVASKLVHIVWLMHKNPCPIMTLLEQRNPQRNFQALYQSKLHIHFFSTS